MPGDFHTDKESKCLIHILQLNTEFTTHWTGEHERFKENDKWYINGKLY